MPLTVKLKNGSILKAKEVENSGMPMIGDDAGRYELFVEQIDGGSRFVYQDEVEDITDAEGNSIDWGNPYVAGHPKYNDPHLIAESIKSDGEWFVWASEKLVANGFKDSVPTLLAADSIVNHLMGKLERIAEALGVSEQLEAAWQERMESNVPVVDQAALHETGHDVKPIEGDTL